LEKKPFSLSLTGRYVGKRYTDDENRDTVNGVPGSYDPFIRWDGKVSYEVSKNIKASLAVLNMADEEHYESYKAPGRLWFAEVEIRF